MRKPSRQFFSKVINKWPVLLFIYKDLLVIIYTTSSCVQGWKPIPAPSGQEWGNTPDRSPANHRSDPSHSHLQAIYIPCMSLTGQTLVYIYKIQTILPPVWWFRTLLSTVMADWDILTSVISEHRKATTATSSKLADPTDELHCISNKWHSIATTLHQQLLFGEKQRPSVPQIMFVVNVF